MSKWIETAAKEIVEECFDDGLDDYRIRVVSKFIRRHAPPLPGCSRCVNFLTPKFNSFIGENIGVCNMEVCSGPPLGARRVRASFGCIKFRPLPSPPAPKQETQE